MDANHQSVDWESYFQTIKAQCPWSLRAWNQGLIDIVTYTGDVIPLGDYHARMYLVHAPNETLEALAAALDHGEDEWLFSYPGYGEFATPVRVLIQQNRAKLNSIRNKLSQDTER